MTMKSTKHSSTPLTLRNALAMSLLVVFGLFATHLTHKSSSSMATSQVRSARHRTLQEDGVAAAATAMATATDAYDWNSVQRKIEKDKAALAIGGIAGTTLAVLAPATLVALYLEDNIHWIPSKIEFVLPTTVDLREPSISEVLDVEAATTSFFNTLLAAAHPGFQTLVLVREQVVKYGNSNWFTDVLDALTGNYDRIYGYEYRFDMLIKVADTDETTKGDLLSTLVAADLTSYLATINALPVNIFAQATQTIYTDNR